ncbi:MAG: helix-turn-helix domain-containing protein [Candidatus Uhrbacteria bacterium]|nr:helix-turn-helix domain-containing protein [Candidatus Uhrbacteria bacterium]
MPSHIGWKEQIYECLGQLTLTEQEKHLYILSLSLGPVKINELAKHLAMPRPNVYKVITNLEKHGLAVFHDTAGRSKTFVVEPPTKIIELLRQKDQAVQEADRTVLNLMPDLLALYHQGDRPTTVRLLQGEEQFRKIFFQILDEAKEEIQFFGSVRDFIGFVSWPTEQEWIKRRIAKNLHIKSLLLPCPEAEALKKQDAAELRETRVLKDSLQPFITSFQLFANKAILWQPKTPRAILIEDEYLVAMLKSIFEILWKASV